MTAALAFAATGISVFIWQSSLLAYEPNRIKADARGDWLTAKAALDGIDAYQNPARLGRHYGVQYVAPGHPESGQGEHFRPPGALLLLTPMAALDADDVFPLTVAVNALLLIVLAFLAARLLGVPLGWALLVSPLATVALPIIQAFEWATLSPAIAVLVLGSWLLLRDGDSSLGGVLLAVAGTLKLYPLLLLIPLLVYRRHRAAGSTVGLFCALQIAGLALLPGVSFDRAFQGMTSAGELWGTSGGNASVAGVAARIGVPWNLSVGLALGAGLAVLWASRKLIRGFENRFAFTLLVATLVSPLSWNHYDVALIVPAIWLALTRSSRAASAGVLVGMAGWLYSWPILLWSLGSLDRPEPFGWTSLAARSLLFCAFLTTGTGDFEEAASPKPEVRRQDDPGELSPQIP